MAAIEPGGNPLCDRGRQGRVKRPVGMVVEKEVVATRWRRPSRTPHCGPHSTELSHPAGWSRFPRYPGVPAVEDVGYGKSVCNEMKSPGGPTAIVGAKCRTRSACSLS